MDQSKALRRFVVVLMIVVLGGVAVNGVAVGQAGPPADRPAEGDWPAVHFDPDRPWPGPGGDVRDPESLTVPPPGFTTQRRNNFYLENPGPTDGLYRWASNGHWSNYDESLVGEINLPDLLRLEDGRRVTSAAMWWDERRPELVRLIESEVYGRVPEDAPSKIVWEIQSTERSEDGKTITRSVVGWVNEKPAVLPEPPAQGRRGFGAPAGPPRITINFTVPVDAGGPVPLVLARGMDDELLARGWGYGSVGTGAVQSGSGNVNSLRGGVIGMTLAEGEDRPADEWGVLRAQAWAMSKAMDYLVEDELIDASRIAVSGHSR